MKKIILSILILLSVFFVTGCSEEKNLNDDYIYDNGDNQPIEEIEKLSEDDDLFLFLTKYNDTVYYESRVTGMSNSDTYTAQAIPRLFYYKDNCIYDIYIDSYDEETTKFDNIPEEDKERYKYTISEIKLNELDEIYLIAKNDENEEFHMVFRYFDKDYKKLIISKGTPGHYLTYDYFYSESDARADASSQIQASTPTVGMTASEVKKTKWGSPDKINKDTYSWGVKEQWVYYDHGYVYLEDGVVTSVSEK